MGNIFEAVLNNSLYYKNDVLNQNDIFQTGFMKGSSTVDNIYILQNVLDKQRFINKPLYVCFVDFSKAFDHINITALLYKLMPRGVKGNFNKVLLNMFEKSSTRIRRNNNLSQSIN